MAVADCSEVKYINQSINLLFIMLNCTYTPYHYTSGNVKAMANYNEATFYKDHLLQRPH